MTGKMAGKGDRKAPRPRHVPQLDSTNAESYYYVKQMAANTPLVVKLKDGEEIVGDLRCYDRSCIAVCRRDGLRLLIPKHAIQTICKQEPEPA